MKFYCVFCQGGLWKNVPSFMLQGYKDKKDFKPTMTAEVRRAGRISMPEGGFGEWPVKSQEEAGVSEGSWDSTAAPRAPRGAAGANTPQRHPMASIWV